MDVIKNDREIITEEEELTDQYSIDDLTNQISLEQDMRKLLANANLTDSELVIIRLKYGFNRDIPLTNEQIAKKWNVSTARVIQLLNRAINKLREARIETIATYTDDPYESMRRVEVHKELIKGQRKKKMISKKLLTGFVPPEYSEDKGLYQIFCSFPKEKVDLAISKLSVFDKTRLYRYFDEYLNRRNLDYPKVEVNCEDIYGRLKSVLYATLSIEELNHIESQSQKVMRKKNKK